MAVTPNYSWPIPVATDYVKDGWDAIADLGNAIDSTVYGLGSAGLTLISSQTVSAVSAVNFSNVLSSSYSFYRVEIGVQASSGVACYFKFRLNTSDITTGYLTRGFRTTSSSAATLLSSSSTYIQLGSITSGAYTFTNLDLFRPNTSQAVMTSTGFDILNNETFYNNGYVSTNVNGFSIVPDSGTITGTVKLYGYKES